MKRTFRTYKLKTSKPKRSRPNTNHLPFEILNLMNSTQIPCLKNGTAAKTFNKNID